MSSYTTELRCICENYAQYDGIPLYSDIDTIINNALPKLFDFEYPVFNQEHKTVLEQKIVRHYYTREICEETIGLWKLRLQVKLTEIMPYYNRLYEQLASGIDMFNNKNITTTYTRNSDGQGTSYNVYSDTPQGSLIGVETDEYMTNASKNKNSALTNENYIENVKGNENLSNLDSWKKYQDYFKDIDVMIIDELKTLFFTLW